MSFDLDFTLVNNQEGIIASFNHALTTHHLPAINDKEIVGMIGIPLNDMFEKISDKDPKVLCHSFREYYGSKGIYQVKLFPGILEKLVELRCSGYKLGVITSKKEDMAVKMMEYLKINHLFDYIKGESEEMQTKSDPNLIRFLREEFDDFKIIIIGDHTNDALLASMLGCPFIGVLSGYFDEKSLLNKLPNGLEYLILNSVAEITSEIIHSLIKS